MKKKSRKAAPDRAAVRRQFLGMHPLRNPEIRWAEEEGRIVLTIPRQRNWRTRLANVFFPVPEEHRVALDAIGSDVWRWADGETSIGQMVQQLSSGYKIGNREAELSLQQFFKDLGRRGYVGFAVEKK